MNKTTATLRVEMDHLEAMLKKALEDKDMLTQSELKLIEGVSKARSELQSTVAEKDSLERDLARSVAEVDSLKQDLDTVLLLCLVSFCALFLPHKHTRPSQGLSLSIDVRVDRLYVRGWIGCGWIGCMCARVEGLI